MNAGNVLLEFLEFSSTMTGFSVHRLRGTGQAELYLSTVTDIVGEDVVKQLLRAFRVVVDIGGKEAALKRGMRREILSDGRLGPVARNIIRLWYTGTWRQLPLDWREAYGANERDRNFVVSADSYVEGLLWPCIGANPSGAKPLGYGTWASPPRIETI